MRELRGEICFGLEENPAIKQQIVVSRSFGSRVTCLQDMQMAVAGFAARAGEKLRQEKQYCRAINVFIRTSPFSPQDVPYASQATEKLLVATQDSGTSLRLLSVLWFASGEMDTGLQRRGLCLLIFLVAKPN